MLQTEQAHPAAHHLDQMDLSSLVSAFVDDQVMAVQAAQTAQAQIAQAVALALPRIQQGGRLIYVGAGTSGRLALLDSVELNPTFSWPANRSLCLLAGGSDALKEAAEGAEDDTHAAVNELRALSPSANDVVVAIAASGSTPYALAALQEAQKIGCLRVAMVNNTQSPMQSQADACIVLDTGPELISGSTRLKAGTAQKIAINTFSSALMVQLHKVHDHWMVDLRITNKKLLQRAVSIVCEITGVSSELALQTLQACDANIKIAIICLMCQLSPSAAKQKLQESHGNLRKVLTEQAIPQT